MPRRIYKGQYIKPPGTEVLRDGTLAVDLATNSLYIHDGSTPGGVLLSGGGIGNVVEDTTPQLGGNLDVNGFSITSTGTFDINIAPAGTGDVNIGTDDTTVTYILGNVNVSQITTFGTTSIGVNATRMSIDGDTVYATGRGDLRLRGGDTNVEDESAGRVILSAGNNNYNLEVGYAGVNGGGAGGSLTVNRGDSSFGGSVTLNGGSGFNEGDGGDVILNPGSVNGSSLPEITGKRGRTKTQRGAFRVTVYANTTARDADILDPGNGDICFVTGAGLQVYDGGWVTLQAIV